MLARKPQKRNGEKVKREGEHFEALHCNNTLIRQRLWHFFSISCSRFTHSLVPFSANFDSSMDSSAVIRSSHYPTGFMSHMQSSLQKPAVIPIQNVGWNSQSRPFIQSLAISDKRIDSHNKRNQTPVSCAKTAEAIDTTKSEASLDSFPKESLEKKPLQTATFPNGFEALVLEVCDETQIAELKVKVGEFEMHMKRNIGVAKAPMSNISPTTPPPIPSKPMVESAPSAPPPSPPKSSPEKTNPFANVSHEKSPKLAALEASGTKNYVLVASPTVGSFRRGRTVKGKKQPPICKEGDIIKEGQVIGYLDQFGTSLPVKSDVTGEVLKLLFQDGEAVGYGDPLIAVLPSFHNIKTEASQRQLQKYHF